MLIVALVKHVPEATSGRRFDPDDHTVDRYGDGLLCELDEYAVEQALVLAEEHGGEVVALTMGPHVAGDALRRALQMGADRGVHVCDDAIAGSDAAATSLVLAEAIRRIGDVDVVVAGMVSTDGSMGVVPAMLAERLDLPQLTHASEVDLVGSTVTIRRDGDSATETVAADLPVMLSVTDQTGEPRYPSFSGITAAKKKPVETWTLADLGVDPSSVGLDAAWARAVAAERRPERGRGTVVVDDGCAGTVLAQYLLMHHHV